MSARREKRLRQLEKRVTALEEAQGRNEQQITHYWEETTRQHRRDADEAESRAKATYGCRPAFLGFTSTGPRPIPPLEQKHKSRWQRFLDIFRKDR